MSKNMDQRVAVRLPDEIARALNKYCEDNYLNRSTVIRMAFDQLGAIKKIFEGVVSAPVIKKLKNPKYKKLLTFSKNVIR